MNYFKNFILNNKINIFYFFVILIISFFIIQNFLLVDKFKKTGEINEKISEQISKLEKSKDIDSDGDGLKDWEEFLYKTDINKTDSDGDGISDFDEVAKKSDPAIFGTGNNENIEKVDFVYKNILVINKKKELLDNYFKEEEEEKRKKAERIFLKKEKAEEELKFLEREKIRKMEARIVLNRAGDILRNNHIDLEIVNSHLGNLFVFNNNKENVLKTLETERKDFDVKNIPKHEKMTEDSYGIIMNFVKKNIKMSEELALLNISERNFLLKEYFSNFSDSKKEIGNSILKISSIINSDDKNMNIEKYILEYTFALRKNVKNRKLLNNFIVINEINFSLNDGGNEFVYSL